MVGSRVASRRLAALTVPVLVFAVQLLRVHAQGVEDLPNPYRDGRAHWSQSMRRDAFYPAPPAPPVDSAWADRTEWNHATCGEALDRTLLAGSRCDGHSSWRSWLGDVPHCYA